MTFVMSLQLLFPAVGAAFLAHAWIHRDDHLAEPGRRSTPSIDAAQLMVRWDDEAVYGRCTRVTHGTRRAGRRARFAIERLPARPR